MSDETKYSRWSFRAWQQWTEWFRPGYNWRNFDLVHIGSEWTGLGSVEFRVGALGFYVEVEFVHSWAERHEKLGPILALRDEYIASTAADPERAP